MNETLSDGVDLLDPGPGDEPGRVKVAYLVHGWRVTFSTDLASPYGGAEELTVKAPASVDDAAEAVASDGLTVAIMRALPLADARQRLANLKSDALRETDKIDAPDRLESPEQWAAFAYEYVRIVQAGYRHPIAELQRRAGIASKNTVSARIRRARDEGYLVGPERRPADNLGPKALKILNNRKVGK